MSTTSVPEAGLEQRVRRGLAWSTLSNLVLRLGSVVVGVFLARLLDPTQFGVFAVALTVQGVLMTLADLGLSADLIRSGDFERKAPTVATLGLVVGLGLSLIMVTTAGQMADLLGSPRSDGVIAVLGVTVLLSGVGVVPYASLNREFQQRKLFLISACDFLIGTCVTVAMILAGAGVISIAVGRVVAASIALILQFRLAGVRPRYGFDRSVSAGALRFGIPVALANLLSWALLSIDTVIISRYLGPTTLGFYVIAFNVSSWPMSTLGQIVRSVALPWFARVAPSGTGRDPTLGSAMAIAWAVAVPAGCLLSLLATEVLSVVYGDRWTPAAPALVALGIFGAVRVAFDLVASFLLARGAARTTLGVQVLWFAALVPAVLWGTRVGGIAGAAWAHVAVALLCITPAYLLALGRAGVDLRLVGAALWPPVAAMAPAIVAAHFAMEMFGGSFTSLMAGGVVGVLVYAALMGRWIDNRVRRGRAE